MTLAQVRPALSERKTPPSSASTIAQTRSEFTGETATPMMPTVPFGRPCALVTSFHVSPPSVLFHNPDPGPPLSRLYGVRLTRQVLA